MTGGVLVGIPLGAGGVPAQTFEHLLAATRGYDVKAHIGRTELNRNWLCQYAIEQGYDWLVMLDVDHAHPADIVDRLLRHRKPVVAALAFQRMPPYDAMAYTQRAEGGFDVIRDWGGGLQPVTWVASCAICIQTCALGAVTFPWWFYPIKRKFVQGDTPPTTDAMNSECPTEDIGFCENCRQAGIEVHVDTGTITPHLTHVWADEALYRAMRT